MKFLVIRVWLPVRMWAIIPIGNVRNNQFFLGIIIRKKRNILDKIGERIPIPKNDMERSNMA